MKNASYWLFSGILIIVFCIPLSSLGIFICHPDTLFGPKEVLLSETENAYNPIPNSDGSLIAYVSTGWGRNFPIGGLGRSNLISDVMIMDAKGVVLTKQKIANTFLAGWTSDGKNLICYRDGKYSIITPYGETLLSGNLPYDSNFSNFNDMSERIAFLSDTNLFLWLQEKYTFSKIEERPNGSSYTARNFIGSVIQSSEGEIAHFDSRFASEQIIVPSPNERYLALIGNRSARENQSLRIYDRENKSWTDLGEVTIHPGKSWDHIKPMWNPWFADSSKLTFVSDKEIVVCTPDGKSRQIIIKPEQSAGLAVASPDGNFIAFATFNARPMKDSGDLNFWGDSTIWVTVAAPDSKAFAVTKRNSDTTYGLRWINNHQLVFDRLADEPLYTKSRLWRVDLTQ